MLAAVQIFLVVDNKILLLKRKKEPYKNCWCPPSGKMELGETPEQAAQRELFEEANITCPDLSLLTKIQNPETGNLNYFFTAMSFEGVVKNNEPDKHETIAWFSLDVLPKEQNWGLRKWLELMFMKNRCKTLHFILKQVPCFIILRTFGSK